MRYELSCPPDSACHGIINLLEVSREKLQRCYAFIGGLHDRVLYRLDSMMRTPDCCGGGSRLIPQFYRCNNISSGALDGRDVKAENVARLVSTADVELGSAGRQVAGHDRVLPRQLAKLTHRIILLGSDESDALGRLEKLGMAKLDFLRPQSTGYMDPIIPGRSLEGLPWIGGPTGCFLLLTV
jgi:hypothetical protein